MYFDINATNKEIDTMKYNHILAVSVGTLESRLQANPVYLLDSLYRVPHDAMTYA